MKNFKLRNCLYCKKEYKPTNVQQKYCLSEKCQYFRRKKTPINILRKYKDGAKNRKLKFNLTFNQFMFFWQKPCFYCGEKIETIGLDRIDNKIGYEINNIVSCCFICNKMKNQLSVNDFINQCKKIRGAAPVIGCWR